MSRVHEAESSDQKFFLTNVAQFQRWFPWLRMFRSFRIAIDYQKLFLALLAVLLWMLGSHLITVLFLSQNDLASSLPVQRPRWNHPQGLELIPQGSLYLMSDNLQNFNSKDPFLHFSMEANSIAWPIEKVTRSFLGLVNFRSYRYWWHNWFQLLLGLSLAALFGGAISRMAARELTGNGRSILQDSKYAVRQFQTAFFAPLIALVCFVFLWGINWLIGLAGRFPVAGNLLIGFLWVFLFLLGFAMALLVLGLILGWPLMICSSAVERNDAFDALSRSFSYLLNQPWYALFLVIMAGVYGSLVFTVVDYILRFSMALSLSSVGAGLGQQVSFAGVPSLPQLRAVSGDLLNHSFAATCLRFWIGLISLVPAAFAFSFCWTSATIGYSLLRRREDGTPLHEIDLSDVSANERPSLAVVGIPAAKLREGEDAN